MTNNGICLTCGGLTSTPMYRCRCTSDHPVQASGNEVVMVCKDGVRKPHLKLAAKVELSREELQRLHDLLVEVAP